MYSHVSLKAALEVRDGLVPRLWFPDTYDFHEYLRLLGLVSDQRGLVAPNQHITYEVLDKHGLRLAKWSYGKAVPHFIDVGEQS